MVYFLCPFLNGGTVNEINLQGVRKLNDLMRILLKAEIDNGSISTLKAQIEGIQKNAKPIKVKVDLDSDKLLKSEQAIQNAIGKTIQKREQENRLLEERQSKSVNKNLDNEYKQQIASMQKAHVEALKMNKVYDEQSAKLSTLKGTFAELRGEQQSSSNIAKALSNTYGNLEVSNLTLNKTTGQYSATLKKSAQENLTLKGSVDQVTGALYVQSEQIKQTGSSQLGFWKQLTSVAGKATAIFSATAVYYQLSKFAKGTITEIKDLNKEMIDLEKVSSASKSELQAFYKQAPMAARQLGVLTSEVIKTSAEISKLGYSLGDTQYLTDLSIIGKTVGDLNNAGQAVDYITSTIKGFRLETEDSAGVLDFMNHTANTTSINFSQIGEGFQRMSASMAEGNNTLQESMGLLVSGFDITRDSERTATALRTISLRLRSISEEGEDLTNLVPSLEAKFNQFGLSLKKDNNTMKSTFEIFKDLSTVYDKMSDMERASILEDISGKRSAQVASAIIQNMQKAIDVSESFDEAQGSALLEHQKYMEGVEAAQNKLASSMTILHDSLLKSGTIVWFYDSASTIVDNVSALGKFSIVLVGVIGALGLFTMANRKAMVSMEGLTIATQVGGIKKLGSDIVIAIKSLLGLKVGLDGATISATALNVATSALLFGIPLIAQGIGMWINSQKKLKEEMESTLATFKEQSSLSTSFNSLVKSYEELSMTSNKTAEEQEKLLRIKEQIVAILPQAETAINSENLSLEDQVLILKELNAEQLEDAKLKASSVINKYGQDIDETRVRLENMRTERQRNIEILAKLQLKQANGVELTKQESKQLDGYIDIIENHNKAIEKDEKSVTMYDSAMDILRGTILGIGNQTKDLTDTTQSLTGEQRDLNTVISDNNKLYEDTTSSLQTYNVLLSEINSKEGLSVQSKQNIITKHQELLPFINDEKELRKQLIAIIQREEEVQRQAYTNMLMYSEDFFNAKVKGNKFLVEKLGEYYNADLENAKTLAEAKAMVEAKLIENLAKQWAKFYQVSAIAGEGYVQTMGAGGLIDDTGRNMVQNMASEMRKVSSLFDGIVGGFGLPDFKSINMANVKDPKKEKKAKDKYSAEADAYQKINLELEKNNNLLAQNKILQDQAGDDLSKKIPLMEKEIELNKQQQELLHQLNQQRRAERDSLESSLSKSGFNFSGEGDSRMITNLDKIQGKSKEVEEQFNRYITLQKTELPKTSQEWHSLQSAIDKVKLDKLIAEFKLADKGFENINKSISDLAYELKMLDLDDFTGKVDNSIKTLDEMGKSVDDATKLLAELGQNGYKEGTTESDAFIARQVELTARLKEGSLAVKEQERALADMIKQQREKVRLEYIKKQNEALAEQRDRLSALGSIEEAIVAIIRKRGEEEKKALDDAHNSEMDSLEKRHNDRKKKYQEETDLFKKMIQDKIDAMDEQNNEEDYLEELQKERDKANELQKQIDVLSLDDSLTARNKVIELRKQLADQNDVIAKKQQKKERDVLKKSLQDQIIAHEKDAKDKEVIADKTFENEKKRLDEDYKINKEFLDKKYSDEKVYAEARESIMRGTVETSKGMFEDIYDAYQSFENKFGKGMGILGDIIKKDFLDQLEKAQQAIKDLEYNSRPRADYDSNYDPGDDSIGWKDPVQDKPSSGGSSGSNKPSKPPEFANWSDRDFQKYKDNKKLFETGNANDKNRASLTNRALRKVYWGDSREFEDKYTWNDLSRFKRGGTTEETGVHILDGEPGKPERVLSQQQTKTFDKLVYEDLPGLQNMLKTFDIGGFQNLLKSAVLSTVSVPRMANPVGSSGGNKYEINFDVKGNLDKSIMPDIQRMITTTIQKTQENKISKYKDVGIRRPI